MTLEDQARVERAAREEPGAVFRGLAELVYAGDDFGEMYQALCDAALHLIEGCDHASIMLARNGNLATAAATDDTARHVDRLERETGEGACVDAIYDEAAQLDADLTSASAWPRLRERILAETPVRGMAGFRLMLGEQKVGALNVFSDRPHALTESSVDQAAVLAAFASVALIAASNQQQARSLREGLQSNREIGKAVGLMMAFHKVDDDEAFTILRRASQDMNVKLAEVAHQVVDHHNRRPPS